MLTKTTLRSGAGTLSVLTLVAAMSGNALAGDLNPPSGAVAPTMKTLDQVESRIPIPGGVNPAKFTITQPGSYYLTANRVHTTSDVLESIVVQSSNVTLDLNGFSIINQNAVMQFGIFVADTDSNQPHRSITIRNGVVTGPFFDSGLNVGNAYAARIENISVHAIAGEGIVAGRGSIVIGSIAERCLDGFAGNRATFVNCSALNNSGDGFRLFESVARDCDARFNGETGFSANTRSVVERCTALDNDPGGPFGGIRVIGDGSRIDSNSISGGYSGIVIESAATNNMITRNVIRFGANWPVAMGNQAYGVYPNNHVAQIVADPTNLFTVTNSWANLAY